MEEKINQRISWIEQRVELSELAKEYIAFQMMQFAKYYHEQQVKSVDLADVGKRSFVATDVHGVLFHDGFADNLEDAIQQTYNAIGDKATTLNFRWIR